MSIKRVNDYILKCLDDIDSRSFEQDQIELLLIMLRNYRPFKRDETEEVSTIREFGDFVAHPEKDIGFMRDKAKTFRHVSRVATFIGKRNFDKIISSDEDYTYLSESAYRTIKYYYKYVKPHETFLEKMNRIIEERENKYILKAVLSEYTLSRIQEGLNVRKFINSFPLSQEQFIFEFKKVIKDATNKDAKELVNIMDNNYEDITVSVMCALHGCEIEINNDMSASICLGYNPGNVFIEEESNDGATNLILGALVEMTDRGEMAGVNLMSSNAQAEDYLPYDPEIRNSFCPVATPGGYAGVVRGSRGELLIKDYSSSPSESISEADFWEPSGQLGDRIPGPW